MLGGWVDKLHVAYSFHPFGFQFLVHPNKERVHQYSPHTADEGTNKNIPRVVYTKVNA